MRIFTGSSDSIGHQRRSGNTLAGVMLCEPRTDMSTMNGLVLPRTDRTGRVDEKIGSLIACQLRRRYVMLCEAVLESGDHIGWRPDGSRKIGLVRLGLGQRILRMLAVRPTIHAGHFSHGRVRNQKVKPSSKRDEDLNLFAWSRV